MIAAVRVISTWTAAIWLLISPANAADVSVDLELVLAIDVSGSMDADEHALQRQGWVAAFRHPGVLEAINAGYLGRIAVTYYEWAGPASQVITAPWMLIDGKASAERFARVLEGQPRAFIRGTSISGGLLFGAELFHGNGFTATRRVIDISGDGPNNVGHPVEKARDQVVRQGITINGLPLMLKEHWAHGWPGTDSLDVYFKDCVIGGRGAFMVPVRGKVHMARAIRRKLIQEIAGGPARLIPASMTARASKSDCFIGEKWREIREEW